MEFRKDLLLSMIFSGSMLLQAAGSAPTFSKKLESRLKLIGGVAGSCLLAYGAANRLYFSAVGDTPLISAIRNTDHQQVHRLLAAGADPYGKNRKGADAFAVADALLNEYTHHTRPLVVAEVPAFVSLAEIKRCLRRWVVRKELESFLLPVISKICVFYDPDVRLTLPGFSEH